MTRRGAPPQAIANTACASASMIWEEKVLNFYVFGWGPKVVRRYREDDLLVGVCGREH